MKITRLELKNFKRFDELTINLADLPVAPKLVLLIGTNGSGKSSVFDAFEFLNKSYIKGLFDVSTEYLTKQKAVDFQINLTFSDGVGIGVDGYNNKSSATLRENSFYGRTSIRQIPKLTRTTLGSNGFSFERDSDRPNSFIDRDVRFENDIEKVTSSILSDVFHGDVSTARIKESYVNPINDAFRNIFGEDENRRIKLISLKPPLEGKIAEILFEKGNSEIPYDYLSSGEKEIFNILLNLLTRREYFQDTVYFMDELDLHLNTQLQKSLLKEITENWIPENCQLWTASHSLGFIEYANETDHSAIIDFDNLNFDLPQVIKPSPKNNFDVFEIAVSKSFLSNVFEGKRIIFSENTDTALYNSLSIPDTIFFNAKAKADVFYKSKNNPSYEGLVDRDYLTDEERADLHSRYPHLYLLYYYSIENYLYHPDNLEEYYKNTGKVFDKLQYTRAIAAEKQAVRDKILIGLARARDGYPFYREQENTRLLKLMRTNETEILQLLNSDNFETFYKVFPAKDYGTEINVRQHISKFDLAKTGWFKSQIMKVIVK
jgi:predicted ATPase